MKEARDRILVVDDEEIHRMGIRDRLEDAGYEVYSVEGGTQAIERVRQTAFDLIILDLLMPQPNGFAVFRHLKELSVLSRTPVLIFTVVGLEPQVQELLERGAYYLRKQDASRTIVAKVREVISEFRRGNRPANEGHLCRSLDTCEN